MLNVLGSVAQWEREAISERIRDAIRHKRSRLESYGPPPFGFSRTEDGRLEPLESEMRAVKRIHALRRDGTPLRAIAAKLNGDRVPTKRGGKWYVSTLQYLLKNDLYAPYLQNGSRK